MLFEKVYIISVTVLQTSIGMMNERIGVLFVFEGHFEGIDSAFYAEVIGKLISHDLFGVCICDEV